MYEGGFEHFLYKYGNIKITQKATKTLQYSLNRPAGVASHNVCEGQGKNTPKYFDWEYKL